jgi:hypothetical protein
LLVPCALDAQTSAGTGIDPDRPDLTDSASLIEPGIVQLETGVTQTRQAPGRRSFQSPIVARIGVRPWLEAQIGTDGMVSKVESGERATGIGDVQFGAKVRLLATSAGEALFTVLPLVNLPVASVEKGLGSGASDYTLNLITGWDLGARTRLDANYIIGAIGATDTGGPGHFVQHTVSASAGFELSDRLTPYVEGFAISRDEPEGGVITSIDGGVIYRITRRMAVDGGVLVGLSVDAPSYSVFGGFSVALGRARSKRPPARAPLLPRKRSHR